MLKLTLAQLNLTVGDIEGNAFTVSFRKVGRLQESASLFDTIVV